MSDRTFSPQDIAYYYICNICLFIWIANDIQNEVKRFVLQADFKAFTFKVIGDGLAVDYFAINADDGEIFAKKDLVEDTGLSYTVSIFLAW